MFTVCFKCNLRLTVTATDLRAAQGYVRCGRCHNVFNALAALADDPAGQSPVDNSAAATQRKPPATPPAQAAPERAAIDSAQEFASTDAALEFNPASTNINEVFIEAAPGERTGTFESIILVGEDGDGAAEPVEEAATAPSPPPPPPPPPAPPAPPVPSPTPAPSTIAPPAPPAAAPPTASRPPPDLQRRRVIPPNPVARAPAPIEPPAEDEIPFMSTWTSATVNSELARAMQAPEPPPIPEEPADPGPAAVLLDAQRAAPRVPRWAQMAGAAFLIACLIVQLVHHYRNALAQTPLLHRPLSAIYQALGQPLEPAWDISRYEVRQLGATTDGAPPGKLVVRASISNRASRDQPLPLLRVVMQDRFGNRVAARDLKPAEYLGRGAPQVSLLAPGQRVDVQVAFQDPGQAATGFELDVCMAGHAHTVTCANDPSSH